ncbi:hypothetical protein AYI69_g6205 [Smittium culicis]|uniref:Uncharacterized protein n=1 Tax=Smittium culicis TaxID=133412 RepID=A0A1R1Y162_9FUNG|nr:hypothetical protein AYI69_g6205 [Smittium culicis]
MAEGSNQNADFEHAAFAQENFKLFKIPETRMLKIGDTIVQVSLEFRSDEDEEKKDLYSSDLEMQRDVQLAIIALVNSKYSKGVARGRGFVIHQNRKNWKLSQKYIFLRNSKPLSGSKYKYRFMIEMVDDFLNPEWRNGGNIEIAQVEGDLLFWGDDSFTDAHTERNGSIFGDNESRYFDFYDNRFPNNSSQIPPNPTHHDINRRNSSSRASFYDKKNSFTNSNSFHLKDKDQQNGNIKYPSRFGLDLQSIKESISQSSNVQNHFNSNYGIDHSLNRDFQQADNNSSKAHRLSNNKLLSKNNSLFDGADGNPENINNNQYNPDPTYQNDLKTEKPQINTSYFNSSHTTSSIKDLIRPRDEVQSYIKDYYDSKTSFPKIYTNRRITTGSSNVFEGKNSKLDYFKQTLDADNCTTPKLTQNSGYTSFKNRSEPQLNKSSYGSIYKISTLKDEILNSEKKTKPGINYPSLHSNIEDKSLKDKELTSLDQQPNQRSGDISLGGTDAHKYAKPVYRKFDYAIPSLNSEPEKSTDIKYKNFITNKNTNDSDYNKSPQELYKKPDESSSRSHLLAESSNKRNYDLAIGVSSHNSDSEDSVNRSVSPSKKVHFNNMPPQISGLKESSNVRFSDSNGGSSPALESVNFKKIYRKSFFEKTKIWKTVQFFENMANTVFKK